jgi:ABC-2 type transport system permease protein
MNIFILEFKMSLKSVITWSVSIFLLLFFYMSIFSAMASNAAILNETLSKMPKELLTAFGMNGVDMSTVLGYFGFAFLFCQICLAIQASNFGFGLVSLEERDMTADFLLAKPVSRTRILTSKLLAALTGLTITNIVIWASSFAAIEIFTGGRPYEVKPLLLLLASIVLFQLFFLTLGILISLLMKKVRNVTPLSMGLAFGMYVLSVFGGMLGDANLEIITPFKHFDPNYILSHASYDLPLVLLSISVIIISIAGSYILYMKRNIHSAV